MISSAKNFRSLMLFAVIGVSACGDDAGDPMVPHTCDGASVRVRLGDATFDGQLALIEAIEAETDELDCQRRGSMELECIAAGTDCGFPTMESAEAAQLLIEAVVRATLGDAGLPDGGVDAGPDAGTDAGPGPTTFIDSCYCRAYF